MFSTGFNVRADDWRGQQDDGEVFQGTFGAVFPVLCQPARSIRTTLEWAFL